MLVSNPPTHPSTPPTTPPHQVHHHHHPRLLAHSDDQPARAHPPGGPLHVHHRTQEQQQHRDHPLCSLLRLLVPPSCLPHQARLPLPRGPQGGQGLAGRQGSQPGRDEQHGLARGTYYWVAEWMALSRPPHQATYLLTPPPPPKNKTNSPLASSSPPPPACSTLPRGVTATFPLGWWRSTWPPSRQSRSRPASALGTRTTPSFSRSARAQLSPYRACLKQYVQGFEGAGRVSECFWVLWAPSFTSRTHPSTHPPT